MIHPMIEALGVAGVSFVFSWFLIYQLEETPPGEKVFLFIFLFPVMTCAVYVVVRGFLIGAPFWRTPW